MAVWQIFLLVLGIFSSVTVATIQFVDTTTFGFGEFGHGLAVIIVNNKMPITLVSATISAVLAAGTIMFRPVKLRKRVLNSLADGIYDHLLSNDKNISRITIYCDAGLLSRLWKKTKDFKALYWSGQTSLGDAFVYCWKARYIRILSRWGNQFPKSKTYFHVDLEDPKLCQGIAGQVRQRQVEIVANLPCLENIDVHSANAETDPVVLDYMKRGYITNISILRAMHRLYPFHYGNIIYTNGGKKKLVLSIDSDAEKNPFTAGARQALKVYITQISAIYGD